MLKAPHLILLMLIGIMVRAQGPVSHNVVRAVVVEGDTLPMIMLDEARVFAPYMPKTKRQKRRFSKLVRNVRKTYPYAKLASKLVQEYEHDMQVIDKNVDQDRYFKLAEKELRAEFEADIKNMTISQGRVLVKLIDRETGQTSYELIKQLRGGFQAFVWQGVIKLFGGDLKDDYDPEVEDRMIETVVRRIERGELSVAKRPARTAKAQAKLDKRRDRLYRKYGLDPNKTSWN